MQSGKFPLKNLGLRPAATNCQLVLTHAARTAAVRFVDSPVSMVTSMALSVKVSAPDVVPAHASAGIAHGPLPGFSNGVGSSLVLASSRRTTTAFTPCRKYKGPTIARWQSIRKGSTHIVHSTDILQLLAVALSQIRVLRGRYYQYFTDNLTCLDHILFPSCYSRLHILVSRRSTYTQLSIKRHYQILEGREHGKLGSISPLFSVLRS